MKSAVILILLSGSLSVYGQGILKFDRNKPSIGTQQFYRSKPLIGNQLYNRNKPLNQPFVGNQPDKNNKQTRPTKIVAPGAYWSAPDNMPVVVPDMATVKPIPNSIKESTEIPFMPNGFRRNPMVVPLDKKLKPGAGTLPK